MSKIIFRIYKRFFHILFNRGLDQSPFVKKIYDFLFSILKPEYVKLEGFKIFLDSKDSLKLLTRGVYESSELEVVEKEIKKGDVIVDVGAHIGHHTLFFARMVGNKGKVFAFEPHPDNFSLLTRNIECNNYNKVVTIVNKAVLDRAGRLNMFLSPDNTGDHRMYNPNGEREFIIVKSTSLDDFFKDYESKINFIKFDIQGAEYKAFQGMREILEKNESIKILTEFWPLGLEKCGIKPKEYLKAFQTNGFMIYLINQVEKKTGRSRN